MGLSDVDRLRFTHECIPEYENILHLITGDPDGWCGKAWLWDARCALELRHRYRFVPITRRRTWWLSARIVSGCFITWCGPSSVVVASVIGCRSAVEAAVTHWCQEHPEEASDADPA